MNEVDWEQVRLEKQRLSASLAAKELGKRRMAKLTAEERKAFSLLGVKARSKSKPRSKLKPTK